MKKVRDHPITTWKDLVNDLNRAGTTVSKKTICNTKPSRIGAHPRPPLLKPSACPGPNHLDDPEEEWEKVMCSDETKIELFCLNLLCLEEEEGG